MNTQEIAAACDAMKAEIIIGRWNHSPAMPWSVTIKAERDGVKVEVQGRRGATMDEALALAWAKFEPASTQGLPPAPGLPAPAPIHDADFDEVF